MRLVIAISNCAEKSRCATVVFAENVAAEVGVPFREITFDTMAYAAANKVSVEMACRELRYEWFEQQRRESGAAYVAVAHHRDDSIETMLLNLIRGTGYCRAYRHTALSTAPLSVRFSR